MLEEKLKKASKDKRRQHKNTALIAISLVAVLALVYLLVDLFPPNGSLVDSRNHSIVDENNESDTEQRLREQYKSMLADYSSDIELGLSISNVTAWNKGAFHEITALKDRSVASFSAGEYGPAIESLEQSINLARETFEEGERLFSEELSLAKDAYREDNYDKAELHVNKALMFYPSSKDALDLTKRIDALPKILPFIKNADVARSENNLEKEYEFIKKAYALDQGRAGLKERLQGLDEKIQERNFSRLILNGMKSVKSENLNAARDHLKEAAAIFSNRDELTLLNKEIVILEKRLRLKNFIKKGGDFSSRDEWGKALAVYIKAAKEYPNNSSISQGHDHAQKIVSMGNELSDFLKNPYRLSSENIAKMAYNSVDRAKPFFDKSPILRKKSSDLLTTIQKLNTKVSVRVVSDMKTDIIVRGVGQVGVVSEKTIYLKPGKYRFEGIRKGYKSKYVDVFIPIDRTLASVRVVCDERI